MTCERGENFGVRDVLQVVMVLGDEDIAERWGNKNMRPLQSARELGSRRVRKLASRFWACRHSSSVVGTGVGNVPT
jgi:hypothetical protein